MVERGDKVKWKDLEGKVESVWESDEHGVMIVEILIDGDYLYCHNPDRLQVIE